MLQKKKILFSNVRAKIPLRVRNNTHIPVELRDVHQAGSLMLDLVENIPGLNIRMVDQAGNIVPEPRSCFANPQYY